MSSNTSNLPVEQADLYVPSLEQIASVLQNGLKGNFKDVKVDVTDCPKLNEKPFGLACEGIGGSPCLLEVGGPPYLLPTYNKEKVYNMKDLAKMVKMEPCFMIGAGAGPWVSVGKNCEMMANVFLSKDSQRNCTYIAKVREIENKMDLEVVPELETRFALLANLFCSEGKPSKVLRVICKQRIGSDNFISSIRSSIAKEFKDKPIGLGGTFLMKSGKAKLHVMPDFSKEPLVSDDALNKWLKFYEVSAPLVGVGTLVSSDIEGLDLRVQHFHTFSDHGEGGHYHYDVTPEEVEYLGYFSLAEKIYRIDKPPSTHQMGRD